MTMASMPYRVVTQLQKSTTAQVKTRDAAFYERLRAAGFKLDFGDDETGLSLKYLRRGSGYYIDVGASALVADGRIGLRSGVEVKGLREHSVVLSDGEELPADLLVYATGYGPMNDFAARLISPEVAQRVGPVWGLGSGTRNDPGPWEGELRNMWKPTAQPGLWFHGGNLQQSRFYSLQLALQIKARMAGIPTPVLHEGMPPEFQNDVETVDGHELRPDRGRVVRRHRRRPAEARAQLAPTGKLRAGMNLGNTLFTTRDAASGELRGVSVDLMRELAARLGVPLEMRVHAQPGEVADSADKDILGCRRSRHRGHPGAQHRVLAADDRDRGRLPGAARIRRSPPSSRSMRPGCGSPPRTAPATSCT
jgi:hypothetical protein